MIDHINSTRPCHILTIEDPIEVLHKDATAVVNQREVGVDTGDYLTALRAAMREDPDVILIGEMRDMETVAAALAAAETGHFVLSTLHTIDATETVNRIVDFFPPYQQHQVRITLAGSLRGIICQRLIAALEGGGRVPALEILQADPVVRNLILEGQFEKIQGLLESGLDSGNMSFNQDLYRLIKAGKISKTDGLKFSPNPQALEMNLKGIFLKT